MRDSLPPILSQFSECDPRWRDRAACRRMPTALFFPEGRSGDTGAWVARAKMVCNSGCPVVLECRAYAISKGIDTGVWGALSAGELKRERRRLRRLRVVS